MIQIGYELHRLATVLLSFFIFLTCMYATNFTPFIMIIYLVQNIRLFHKRIFFYIMEINVKLIFTWLKGPTQYNSQIK